MGYFMADTTFIDKTTVIATSWLQNINDHVFKAGTTAKHYAKDISWTQAGASAVARTVESKLYEIISLKDFGAVGDGVVDDTVAIQSWLNAITTGQRGHAPAGTYKFTNTLNAPLLTNIAITGDGPYQTVFCYSGTSTTKDLFVIGNGIANMSFWYLENFRITSATTMTAGSGFHFKRLDSSVIRDVIADGLGGYFGSRNLWNGYYFDGAHIVYMSGFNTSTQHDGIVIVGRAVGNEEYNCNLYLNQGCSDYCGGAGIRSAGDFGGLFVDQCEFMGNVNNIVVDNSLSTAPNYQILLGSNVISDGLQMPTASYGILIDDSLSNQSSPLHISINGFIGSSYLATIYVKSCKNGVVSIGANRIFNSKGDGILVDDATTIVQIGSQTIIDNNAGWGIRSTVPTTNISFDGKAFANTLGDFSPNSKVGVWTTYTPTISSTSGNITTSSATGSYSIMGKTVSLRVSITITANGTGASAVEVTLPTISKNTTVGVGRANTVSGKILQAIAFAGNASMNIVNYDNTYPAVSGESIEISIVYESN
jgi:hypothetical protein